MSVFLPQPTAGYELQTKEEIVVFPVQPFEPRAPEPPREDPKPPGRRTPVPDPTPDDPEPLLVFEPMEADVSIPDVDVLSLPDPPQVPDRGPLQVGGEVLPAVRISGPDPRYSEIARRARIEGTVVVEAIVSKHGLVKQARVTRGLGWGLDEAAVSAIEQWRFEPATAGGEPVDVYYLLRVNFSVD